jgi:lipoprotein-anchoring transpeptidase ErfK/SrfK
MASRQSPVKKAPPTYAAPPRAYQAGYVAEAPTEIWVRSPEPRRSGRFLWIVGGLFVFLFACVTAVAVGGAALFYYSDVILPGTQAFGLSVGGQTRAEAAAALQARWRENTITLEAGGERWTVPPDALGMTLDGMATAEHAYRQGRSLNGLETAMRNGGRLQTPPVWAYDPAVAQAKLIELAPSLEVTPRNAGVELVNGRFEATPPTPGQSLDVAATLAWLQQNAAQVLATGRLPLVTTAVQPAITDTTAVAVRANQLLVTPLAVRAYDPVTDETLTWTIAPEVWAGWLSLDVDAADPSQFSWVIDEGLADAFLVEQGASLGAGRYLNMAEAVSAVTQAISSQNPAVRLRVYHHPRQHVVQAGETLSSIGRDYGIPYPWIQAANPGVSNLSIGQTITIPSPDEMLPLPVVENKRIVVSISAQRVWVYENGSVKWEWPASTGIASSPTSPGIFQVRSHEKNAYAGNWDLWMPDFLGIYQPVPTSAFMNGFHGFPTRGGSQLLWTGDLGRPVTYGCILLSSTNAQTLYEWAEEGVIVEIQP